MSHLDALVERLYSEVEPVARAGGDWQGAAMTELRTLLSGVDPRALVDEAREHRRWSFAVAEAAGEVCAKPPEAAAYVMLKIVEELLEERGITA